MRLIARTTVIFKYHLNHERVRYLLVFLDLVWAYCILKEMQGVTLRDKSCVESYPAKKSVVHHSSKFKYEMNIPTQFWLSSFFKLAKHYTWMMLIGELFIESIRIYKLIYELIVL